MKKHLRFLFPFLVLCFTLLPWNNINAQVQRNPVIEACTGTWCQWCPCGHTTIDNILVAMPNAIAIEYHGPANTPSDPWSVFNGNQVIGLLGFSAYPTGIIDRTSAPLSRDQWSGVMSSRFNIPAPVDITITKSYNKITRALDVTIHSTAQVNLTGEYKLSFIILESGLVYNQVGNGSCPGDPNYIHNHVVRSLINGATGESLNGGNQWDSLQTINTNIQWSVPSQYVAENCELAAFVYKVSGSLNVSEIQQGQKWPLISPDYVPTLITTVPDLLTSSSTPGEFDITIRNDGLMDDTYYIEGMIDGPSAWAGEFTTSNGTFNFGQKDSLSIIADDSAEVAVSVNPNGTNGFGEITLRFTSKGDSGVIVEAKLRLLTPGGVDYVVVDASGEGYGNYIVNSLERVAGSASYGAISRSAFQGPNADLANFYSVAWVAGNKIPVFQTDDVTLLQNYLDQGGRLLITGQDIGSDINDPYPWGQSNFAADFYHNYLHADYVQNGGPSYSVLGITGDPIGDQIAFDVNTRYTRYLDEIAPLDAYASGVFEFSSGDSSFIGLKAVKDDYRVAYYAFGLEQIDAVDTRDSIVARSFRWLMEGITTGVNNNEPGIVHNYSLNQNYPNPFNPNTQISYSIANAGNTSLTIYDIMGREVTTLVNGHHQPGTYSISFDASSLSSGMYIYKIVSGNYTASKKMIVLK